MLEVAVLAHGVCVCFCEPMRCFRRARLQGLSRKLDGKSFAKLHANQGAEWLRGSLQELGRDELRSLAVGGGIRAKIGDRWLPVTQLRSALMEALAPTEQAQS